MAQILDIGTAVYDPSAVEHVLSSLQNVQITKYVTVATFMLSVYEYYITLSDEISLVWPSHWGASKILFFINRYFVFIDEILIIYVLLIGSAPKSCLGTFQASGAFSAFGFVVAQVILMVRTWAIWGRKLWVTILLAVLLVGAFTANAYALAHYLAGVSAVVSTLPSYRGCNLQFSNRLIFVAFILVIVTETVMLVLLFIKALEHFQNSRNTVMKIMFKDGVVYFIFILITSIANLVTILIAPMELHSFLIITQRALHSIFCTRVLLHIRGAYANRGIAGTSSDENPTVPHYEVRGTHTSRFPGYPQRLNERGTAFELSSMGANVSLGVVEGGDGSGWGMGYGFGGMGEAEVERERERERRRSAKAGRLGRTLPANEGAIGKGDEDNVEDEKMSASTIFPPLCEELPYHVPELEYGASPESELEHRDSVTVLNSSESQAVVEATVGQRRPFVLRHVSFSSDEREARPSSRPHL